MLLLMLHVITTVQTEKYHSSNNTKHKVRIYVCMCVCISLFVCVYLLNITACDYHV